MPKTKDITGIKFGKLTAIKRVGRDRNYRSIWYFSCDCGGNKTVDSHRVINGTTRSCGCIRKYDGNIKAIENQAFNNHKMTAIRKGLDWNLSKEQYLFIAKNPCVYCGEFSIRKSKSSDFSMKLNSVDRINNEPYYKIHNCQSVCFIHQSMKSNIPDDKFLKECMKIINYKKIKWSSK